MLDRRKRKASPKNNDTMCAFSELEFVDWTLLLSKSTWLPQDHHRHHHQAGTQGINCSVSWMTPLQHLFTPHPVTSQSLNVVYRSDTRVVHWIHRSFLASDAALSSGWVGDPSTSELSCAWIESSHGQPTHKRHMDGIPTDWPSIVLLLPHALALAAAAAAAPGQVHVLTRLCALDFLIILCHFGI